MTSHVFAGKSLATSATLGSFISEALGSPTLVDTLAARKSQRLADLMQIGNSIRAVFEVTGRDDLIDNRRGSSRYTGLEDLHHAGNPTASIYAGDAIMVQTRSYKKEKRKTTAR